VITGRGQERVRDVPGFRRISQPMGTDVVPLELQQLDDIARVDPGRGFHSQISLRRSAVSGTMSAIAAAWSIAI
jgi:hypothetical protein